MSAGNVGIVSRSGTLTYQTAEILNRAGFGESTCLGIGGDPVGGLGFVDVLALFEKDPETKIVVMIGEIGGQGEEAAAAFIKKNMTKPVVAFVAGQERAGREDHGPCRSHHLCRKGDLSIQGKGL